MDDIQFRRILKYFNLSWEGYKKVRKGVKKRIDRHMQGLRCRDVGEYLEYLDGNPFEKVECRLHLTVSISRFFRDKKLWEILEKEILYDITKKIECTIRAWSAGCASGEEVYSLKIIWESSRFNNSNFPELNITATDINPRYIQRGIDGVYGSSSLKEVPEKLLSESFKKVPGKKLFQIDPSLKTDIIWLERSLFSEPPLGPFHIVFLRNNLLTYYEEEMSSPVVNRIVDSMCIDGYLVIGSHEQLPHNIEKQLEIGPLSYIYKKTK